VAPVAVGTESPTDCPEQILVAPFAVIVLVGNGFTVTAAHPDCD